MKSHELFWIVWIGVVALADVAIPFGLKESMEGLTGAFGFWIALTAAVIVSGALFTSSWGSSQDRRIR